jgi:prolyl-tRNA synthetase
MLRGKPEDAELKTYCATLADELAAQSAFGSSVRAFVDTKDARPADKRWDWVRRGAPIICEIGPRDAANGQVTFIKRNALREGEKVKSHTIPRADFVARASALLGAAQAELFAEAKARLDGNVRNGFSTFGDLVRYFGANNDDEFKGWARVHWAKPHGAALEEISERLKKLKLTIRNAPRAQPSSFGACVFTGAPAVEEILIARAY